MKEKGKKSPWRFVCWAGILYGGLELLSPLAAWLLSYTNPIVSAGEAASIGIIGGADGPTAIFVAATGWGGHVLPVLLLVAGVLGLLWIRRSK